MEDEGSTPGEEMGEHESGPFCRHWSSLGDCDEMCKCGHTCAHHSSGEDDGYCYECACEDFSVP